MKRTIILILELLTCNLFAQGYKGFELGYSNPPGKIGLITNGLQIWLDSSGMQSNGTWVNNVNGEVWTSTALPTLDTIEGNKAMLFGYPPSKYLTFKKNINMSDGFTIFSVFKINSSGKQSYMIYNIDSTLTAAKLGMMHMIYGTNARSYLYFPDTAYLNVSAANYNTDSVGVIVFRYDNKILMTETYAISQSTGAWKVIYKNSLSVYKNFTAYNTWAIGTNSSGATFPYSAFWGFLKGVYIYNRALSEAEINSNLQVLNSSFDLKVPTLNYNKLVVCYGNSLMFGMNWHPCLPEALQVSLGSNYYIINFGISSQTTAQLITQYTGYVKPFYDTTKTNYMIIWEGTNSAYAGVDSTTILNQLYALSDSARSRGFKTIGMSYLPRSGGSTPANFEVIRQAVNRNLRLFWNTHYDAFYDAGNDGYIGQTGQETNTNYYTGDNTHLLPTGYAILGHGLDSVFRVNNY